MKFKIVKNIIELARASDLNRSFHLSITSDEKRVSLKEENGNYTLFVLFGLKNIDGLYCNAVVRKDLTKDQLRCAAEKIQSKGEL